MESGNAYEVRVVDCMQAVTVRRRFNVPHMWSIASMVDVTGRARCSSSILGAPLLNIDN